MRMHDVKSTRKKQLEKDFAVMKSWSPATPEPHLFSNGGKS